MSFGIEFGMKKREKYSLKDLCIHYFNDIVSDLLMNVLRFYPLRNNIYYMSLLK